jgi:hypothetical protein
VTQQIYEWAGSKPNESLHNAQPWPLAKVKVTTCSGTEKLHLMTTKDACPVRTGNGRQSDDHGLRVGYDLHCYV